MFLRDAQKTIMFQELQERAVTFRNSNTAEVATTENDDTRSAPLAIRASVDLETAASIAYSWFVRQQTILILNPHTSPDSSPSASQ